MIQIKQILNALKVMHILALSQAYLCTSVDVFGALENFI